MNKILMWRYLFMILRIDNHLVHFMNGLINLDAKEEEMTVAEKIVFIMLLEIKLIQELNILIEWETGKYPQEKLRNGLNNS